MQTARPTELRETNPLWRKLAPVAFGVILLCALGLRVYKLDKPVMWVDEAESSINALTILQHGYPTNTYLGLPIYENILTEPWPESKEYEFRDSSYSDNGAAVYHGWLPLYSMALSFKIFGIEPDVADGNLRAKHSDDEIWKRTIAARAPAVVFGMIFLLLVFQTGKEMYGDDAAWAAFVAAAFAVPIVHLARQARYYSATITLCMACCLMGWRMLSRGRWRDFVTAGACYALMFHTHVLTFLIVCVCSLALAPGILKHPKSLYKCGLFLITLLAGIAPWIVATGFLTTVRHVPKAIDSLYLIDFLNYPLDRWPVALFLVVSLLVVVFVHRYHSRLPKPLVDAFYPRRGAMYFMVLWGLAGYLVFMLMIPAASLWFARAYLGNIGPGIVLGAMIFAGFARLVERRVSIPIASALFIGFIWVNLHVNYTWKRDVDEEHKMLEVVEMMRNWGVAPDARIYSTPNDHLTIQFFTGVPVQSVAPVRKEFLDNYPGEVVLLECVSPLDPIRPEEVYHEALRQGEPVSYDQSIAVADGLTKQGLARFASRWVQSIEPRVSPQNTTGEVLIAMQREKTRHWEFGPISPIFVNPAVFRGYFMPDYTYWWKVFFYRYVDPYNRVGVKLNYANRLRSSRARILNSYWAVYRSPAPTSEVAN